MFDPFLPPHLLPSIAGDGVVTGSGTVYGRPVFAFSQDFTGALGVGQGGLSLPGWPLTAMADISC